ncbi:MAG: bestrophin family ion channel [Gemmataceae bacterium]
MINYDRSAWWKTCFAWRGTVLLHVLDRVGLLTGFCLVLYLVDEHLLKPNGTALPGLDPLGHNVLGVALSMLIVFRTNSSNNRFWEARSHWGMLVNTSRNLVRMASTYAPPAEDLARLVAAYVFLLKEQLRDLDSLGQIRHLVPGRLMVRLEGVRNPAQVLAMSMSEWVAHRLEEKRLDPIVATRMEELICLLVDNQGGCEKIHRTPLPFVYAALIKQVLFLYLVTLPFVLVPKLTFMAPLVVAGVSLGMLGIEEAGVEIEDPFGLDLNHLPLDQICDMIRGDTADLATTASRANVRAD